MSKNAWKWGQIQGVWVSGEFKLPGFYHHQIYMLSLLYIIVQLATIILNTASPLLTNPH